LRHLKSRKFEVPVIVITDLDRFQSKDAV
jgi:hypothetical protein